MSRERGANSPQLAPTDAQKLIEIFRAEAGLAFTDDAASVIERRLRERVHQTGTETFASYVELLRRGGTEGQREIEEALELVTTHETYFFREEYQLSAFAENVIPELVRLAESKRRLSLWSAGCSTGEEAYTLAMILQSSPLLRGWELRVLGTDLSRKCVGAARRAIYGKAAFRAAPKDYRDDYFVEEKEGTRVVPAIRELCSFAQLNLLHPERGGVIGRTDAIFCRNVLIYLDADARRRVIDTLYDRLTPGGFLMLGHSESLLNVPSSFEPVHLSQDLVYRKPGGSLATQKDRG